MAKILLVEDDNNLREIYEARLQAEGYEISSAQDGEQALVVAKQFKPDLVISDVMMPKISGFEMLDIMRNTPGLENTRVIMLTALGQAEDKSRADQLGADRYLVKSQVTLEDIVKAAHEIIDGGDGTPAPVAGTEAVTDDTATQAQPAADPAPAASDDNAAVAQPEPAADPVAAPAPEPTPEPTVPDSGSTATEQATVDAQIENFAAAPAVDPPVADSANDDALLADAAESLAEPTEEAAAAPAEPAESAPSSSEAPAEPATSQTEATNDGVTIAKKKVIQPPAAEDKPSLNELLAKEEAKEAGLPTDIKSAEPTEEGSEQFPGVHQTDETTNEAPSESPAAPVESPKKQDGFDPNHIAL